MRYLDEYRNSRHITQLIRKITKKISQPWTIMEVCGGQTHAIIKFGLDKLLPDSLTFLHGPGCPVCVTPLAKIDQAQQIAFQKSVILCTYGDMLRVPGTRGDLLYAKAQGARVQIVYSPLDAIKVAENHPLDHIVFFAIGFETTAPASAMAVKLAKQKNLKNFSLLVSHVLTPPVIAAILQSPLNRVQGFLGPGHVCTVTGLKEYEALSAQYHVPIVVTGFEPLDLLQGIDMLITQLESDQSGVENQYSRSVHPLGNRLASDLVNQVFDVCDQMWRGIGMIPKSGLKLAYEYQDLDALKKFDLMEYASVEAKECISGQILKGSKKPNECPAFGRACTPKTPLGATMVSSEGTCAAYFAYGRSMETRMRS